MEKFQIRRPLHTFLPVLVLLTAALACTLNTGASDTPGEIEIDSIAVKETGLVYDFFGLGETLSYVPRNDIEEPVIEGGMMRMQSVGDDPLFHLPLRGALDAANHPTLELQMKISAGNIGRFFFQPVGGVFSEDNSLVFELIPDGAFHTYTLDPSAPPSWSGYIRALHFDPTDLPAEVVIDYLLLR